MHVVEKKYNLKLQFCVDPTATSDNYSIEKIKNSKKTSTMDKVGKPIIQNNSSHYQDSNNDKEHSSKHKQKWKIANKPEAVDQHSSSNNVETQVNKDESVSGMPKEEQVENEKTVSVNDTSDHKIKSKRKYINKKSNYSRQAKTHSNDTPKTEKDSATTSKNL